ncbi:MAG: SDR family NAD(P)-dependent oxidoreductase [Ilumatobacteraceae bacterium]
MEPVAIVGVSAILPDAPDAATFWDNVSRGRYSISEVLPSRWDPALYFDEDHDAPDKTYSKIGGWVRDWEWDPLAWKLPIPPKVSDAIDDGQKWAIACTRAVLADHGKPIDHERTAVILGNAMAGEHHYQTALRIATPEIVRELHSAPSFQQLPAEMRSAITEELGIRMSMNYPEVTEDTMAGELGNVMAGRVANLFDFHGPNFIVDAACASAMAAIDASIEGLIEHEFDTVVTGGIDRNMGASSFVKFCKIGALSATGTRPFDAGADGFVMGEGAALFLLKRLADAERDGDRVYAVLRGIAGASDGKGKGITAPNPVGQRLAVARAWSAAGLSPSACGLMEAHGTSTRVGDVVEVTSLGEVFASAGLAPGAVALGSAKSNIGHLKAAAGAAGILKATLALHHKVLPPSLNFSDPNPNIDWSTSPFRVNTELREWSSPSAGGVRTAGVSAFGFGGTNFHVVLEEHVPGRLRFNAPKMVAVGADLASAPVTAGVAEPASLPGKAPLRGALLLGATNQADLIEQLRGVLAAAESGVAPAAEQPSAAALAAPERLAIDYGDARDLVDKATRALAAFETPAMWTMLRGRGVFRGTGPAAPIAFMYTGQGSQYVNMLSQLRAVEPIVAERFVEADRVMTPLLGKPLSDYIFIDAADPAAVDAAEEDLRNTEITQPAVLATDLALTALLTAYGVEPDMVIGHSLGEYGALVAAGALSFPGALEAVSARGHEMASLTVADNGIMAAVFAPVDEVQRLVDGIDGNVVLANVNSNAQSVIGGATTAVETALAACEERGWLTARLTVSHAFHTSIVAAASEPLRRTLERLELHAPIRPIVSNVTGEFYPMGPGVGETMLDLLAQQVASPVQFVKGLHTLYDAGARVFVEVGPKRALHGFATDVLGEDVTVLFTNHPKQTDVVAFNQALCGLYAAGHGAARDVAAQFAGAPTVAASVTPTSTDSTKVSSAVQTDLGALFDDFLDKARSLMGVGESRTRTNDEPVVITGAALGTPGTQRVFDDENLARLLHGEQLIDVIPGRLRNEILDKHIVRLTKSETRGASFEAIDSVADVIKLAGRAGSFDLAAEFGVEADRLAALGRTTQLAIGAGLDALRDAGIPIVQRYKTTHLGTQLPERWGLPDALRDETGIIFASAFPGLEELADEVRRYEQDRARRLELDELQAVRARVAEADSASVSLVEIDRRIHDVQRELEVHPYLFDRRFLFRVLSMGHSQFAELIGARGPNTQINSACASTTQAISLAEDWIRAGRCRRVIVIAADDATSDDLLGWIGAGFLATGAAATDEDVTEAALPFDKRRHGMIIGMGAAALVVESADAARERGVQPICEVLGAVTANSAFHGTRLDVEHIGGIMEAVVRQGEARGADRAAIASELVFVSHETYTPARGGSAAAEIHALRHVFGVNADRIVIANTKGVTGHPMGVGLEDVVAVKALETGIVPPVANFREVDPELGSLNLSRGGSYPVRCALRLAAGFGSQISMVLLRWTPVADGRHRAPDQLGYAYRITDQARWSGWLRSISGQESPQMEVVQRRLRIVDNGPGAPATPAAATPAAVAPVAPRAVNADTAAAPVSPAPAPAPAVAALAVEADPVVAATPSAPAGDEVAATILRLVAEQTGYPPEMLDLDLDLEADLGVDTVKQAELFAAVREAYGIERDDKLKLRDYPTLAHVIGFVHDRAPQTVQLPAAVDEPGNLDANPVDSGDTPRFPRRVPVPVVRPALELCETTGVELAAGDRVVVYPDTGGAAVALTASLAEMGVEVLLVDAAPDRATLESTLQAWRAAGPISGVFWLPALDQVDLAGLDPASWSEALRVRVKLLATTMRVLYDDMTAGHFLVSAVRLGGSFGYDVPGAQDVLGGATSGFTKALARERADALVKVVDFATATPAAEVAGQLLAEVTHDPGIVEVGRAGGLRWGIGVAERDVAEDPARLLGPDDVIVVTGAAGSIVSAITTDLAMASRGTFHLIDLTPEPLADDPDLERFVHDHDGLKADIAHRITERGERATPALVERELARLERSRAALDAIQAVQRAGGTVHWYQADLTDFAAVHAAVEQIVARSGRVDVLLHCAGLEISRFLPDKTDREYDLVFDVKSNGWFHLLHALGDTPLGAAVVFSSIAGRFGNGGQTDYSAANDLLCKSISAFRSSRPATRGVAIDWTAWASIGMASRGSIPKMMAMAGIDMLPPEVGIPVVRHELTAAGAGGEVVVAGSLGIMLEESPTGGLDAVAATAALAGSESGPMIGEMVACTLRDGLVVRTTLTAGQPFLDDHRIDGTPVLPGVMGMEAFAEAAAALVPGWEVHSLSDVEFLAPFKLYRDDSRVAEIRARLLCGEGGSIVAECALVGRRSLPGQPEQVTTHFVGNVVLAPAGSARPAASAPGATAKKPPASAVAAGSIYEIYFHGPAYQVLDQAWAEDEVVVGATPAALPANHQPDGRPLLAWPRLVELCFQTAGVHELGTTGSMALPAKVGRVDIVRPSSGGTGSLAGARAVVTRAGGGDDAVVVDAKGKVVLHLSGYTTTVLPGGPDDALLMPLRAAMVAAEADPARGRRSRK